MLKKGKEIGAKVLLTLLTVFFCVLAGEFVVRFGINRALIYFPQPDFNKIVHRYSDSYDLVYDLQASVEGFDGSAVVKTNSLAMKDQEYPAKKPEGSRRIIFIGDSVTFGPGVLVDELYTELLEKRLNTEGRQVEIMNAAVVGYNSVQEDIVLREKVSKLDPDLIVVGYCLNDNSPTDGFKELARQMHPDSIGSRLHSKFISLVLDRLEDATGSWFKSDGGAKRLFKDLGQIKRDRKIGAAVIIFPYHFESPDRYKRLKRHERIRQLAEAENVDVIDFLEITKVLSPEERKALYQPEDHAHFSPAGMKAIANWLYNNEKLMGLLPKN